jgi:hypothetical protein
MIKDIEDVIAYLEALPESDHDYFTCYEDESHGDMKNMSFVSHNPTDLKDRNFLRVNVWCGVDDCCGHGHPFLATRQYIPNKVKEFIITEFRKLSNFNESDDLADLPCISEVPSTRIKN